MNLTPAADRAVVDGAVALAWTAIDAATGGTRALFLDRPQESAA